MSDFQLDFQDAATAFADKTDKQLKEKYSLFKRLNSPFLSAIARRGALIALSLGLPVEGIIKSTIFAQFCGGETIDECSSTVELLAASRIGSILDFSGEGKSSEEDFDRTKDEILRTIERGKGDPRIPFAAFKTTGIAPLGTLERLSAKKKLDAKSQAKAERIKKRFTEICECAYDNGQRIFVDAEDSWIQDAIDRMATEMMERFNKERPLIFTDRKSVV